MITKLKLNALWAAALLTAMGLAAAPLRAAGTLKSLNSTDAPIRIQDHHVAVVVNNGFARTEVAQTFHNPNQAPLEGVYVCPVPKNASLSELTIVNGERVIEGEVLEIERARQAYEQAREEGDDAGLAVKAEFQTYRFAVTPILPSETVKVRYVYYQPVAIDTGVGRYVYPLQDGGVDEAAKQFWLRHEQVDQDLTFDLELKSGWPLLDVRMPGFEQAAQIADLGDGRWQVSLQLSGAKLNRDLAVYYMLDDRLPGRVEMMAFRDDETEPGTFMLTVTPGIDLQPINRGADYVFVLDVSGSMQGKIATLAEGVSQALGQMNPEDRFRVVAFEATVRELTSGWRDATPENVNDMIRDVRSLKAGGGTNLFRGMEQALKDLDDERAASIVLVTDAETNTGVVDPVAFHQLMQRVDLRVFGFLLGNNANFPLMRTICDASGGYWTQVSNADDIIGQILLAKSKIVHESLHDVALEIDGVKAIDLAKDFNGKIYRGQQLTLFGRYERGGRATVRLKASLTGEDKVYETTFQFPEFAEDHPELERLWAMSLIEDIELRKNRGGLSPEEAEARIRKLGVDYQLVTDHTAMVALSDARFEALGVERRNRDRVARERTAQAQRAVQPVQTHRVDDEGPMFQGSAPSVGGGNGGGAFDPLTAGLAILFAVMALALLRRQP